MSEIDRYYKCNRAEVAKLLPSKINRVLEIGCAAGGFRENVGGCEYWGVEMISDVADLAKNKLDKVLVGAFEDVYDELPDNYFDMVVCNDVIEHMMDYDTFLENIKNKMTSNGRILGSIPNVRHVDNLKKLIFYKDWKYGDSGVLDRTHLRFFTLKSLRQTLLSHKYEIEVIKGINSSIPK